MRRKKGNSVSFMDKFWSCERLPFLDARHPEEDREAKPALRKGIAVHRALELLADAKIAGAPTWQDALAQVTGVSDLAASYAERVVRSGVLEHIVPTKTELWIRELDLGEPFGVVPWRGRIDLISDTCFDGTPGPCLVDWKTTSSRMWMRTERDALEALQLAAYCLATGARRAAYVYLLPVAPPEVVEVDFSESDLDIHRRRVYDTSKVIGNRWDVLADDWSNWREVLTPAPPGDRLCTPHHCRHWERCFPKEV